MSPADLPAVLAIEREAFPTPWTAAMFRGSLKSGPWTARVMRHDGGIVGYIIFALVVDECDLLNIAVAVRARRQGIGRRLIDAMLADVRPRGATVVYLDVRVSNAAALALYRAFGFQAVGRRKRYYAREGEDAVVMALSLSACHIESSEG